MEPLALASPHGPISYYLSFTTRCVQGLGVNVAIPHAVISPLTASTLYQWNHTVSSPHTTSPSTHPAFNSPLTYGVIRLPAGGSSQNLNPSMWSGTFNWSHTCNGAISPHCELTCCRPGPKHWGQPQWPPIRAPHTTTTSSSQQMEPADPLPVSDMGGRFHI